jgi:hypothetical protein
MALGDLTVKDQNVMTGTGARLYNVAAGTPINAGEPVQVRALGNTIGFVVEPALTSTPDASAHLYVGVAATNSTNTTAAAGTVNVTPISSAIDYLIAPDVAATWDTQAEYDALVGARVLIKNSVSVTATPTSGTYTLLATDSTNNGCVVQPLEIFKYPGKVAFAFRGGSSYLS